MSSKKSIGKGLLAGAVGGALGTVVLNVFQKASLAGTRAAEGQLGDGQTYTRQQEQLLDTFEEAHTKTAEVVAAAAGTHLSPTQHEGAAPVTEYVFGILCGAVYGALAEYLPFVTNAFGTTYGAVLFAGASEVVLPALGWVPSPANRTPVQHLGGLSGNMVYGAATEGVRRLVRKAL